MYVGVRGGDSFGAGIPSGMIQDQERKDGQMMVLSEFRADQVSSGVGGLARNSSGAVSVSNTSPQEIMSRYRPIAPKPQTLKPGESAVSGLTDPPSSSTLSFERTSVSKAVSSDGSRGKRSRKRIGAEPLLPPTRRAKRGPAAKPRTTVSSSKGPAVIGGIQKAVEQFAPNNKSVFQPMPIPTETVFRSLKGGGASRNPYVPELATTESSPMFNGSEGMGTGPGGGRVERRRVVGFGALKVPENNFGTSGSEWSLRGGRSLQDAACAAPPTSINVGIPPTEEPAFMDRAALASASPQPYFERQSNGFAKFLSGYDGGFDTYSPKRGGTDGPTFRATSIRPVDVTCPFSPSLPQNSNKAPPELQPRLTTTPELSFVSSNGERGVNSGGNNSHQTNLVTLSLLPDTPSHHSISSEAFMPASTKHHLPPFRLSLGMGSDSMNWDAETKGQDEPHKLSLYSESGHEQDVKLAERRNNDLDGDRSWGRRSSSAEKQSRALALRLEGRAMQEQPLSKISSCRDGDGGEDRAAVVDFAHMDQAYSTSCDPMILNDAQTGEPLWANQAYKKADAVKNGGKTKETGAPYLDPLGVPTMLSSFDYQIPQGPATKAILWGFLKKFMRLDTNGMSLLPENSCSRGDGEGGGRIQQTQERSFSLIQQPQERNFSLIQQAQDRNFSLTQQGQERNFSIIPREEILENPQSSSYPKPITPQAVRPVGSTLTLDHVESLNQFASAITDNLESVKEQLESSLTPSVITDCKNRVRWVNAAYKQMVGQPECPWLESMGKKTTSREISQHNRLTGEVMLTCSEQLSEFTAVFSCQVHVRWTKDGEEKSITVPAEVTRIATEKLGDMFMWKLGAQSSNLILPKRDGVFR